MSVMQFAAGSPARIFEMFVRGEIVLCYDSWIMAEYKGVLSRPHLAFKRTKICGVINRIRRDGIAVTAKPCGIAFGDEDDKMFYEVAREYAATLVTGNTRHYPAEPFIQTAAEFLAGCG